MWASVPARPGQSTGVLLLLEWLRALCTILAVSAMGLLYSQTLFIEEARTCAYL